MSEIVVNVTDPGSYAVSVEGATPTTATVSNGGSVTVSMPGADVAWGDLVGLPAEFPPEDHVHEIAEVTGLQAALDGKADAGHGHAYPVTSVNGLTGDVVIEAGGGGAELSDATPEPLGTAAAGTGTLASRADHVHALPTAADIGAIDSDSVIDGGDYVGELLYTITITAQPQDQSVELQTATFSYSVQTAGQIPYSSSNGNRSLMSNGTTAVVVREGGVWTSVDSGATWTQSSRTFDAALNARTMCAGYGNNKWVAVDAVNGISYTKTADPSNANLWTETTSNGFLYPAQSSEASYIFGGQRRIVYGDGVFLASSASSYLTFEENGNTVGSFFNSELMASTDGQTWTQRSVHPLYTPVYSGGDALSGRLEALANNGSGKWVCCGVVSITASERVFRIAGSTDSIAWSIETLSVSITVADDSRRAVAAFGNGYFVIIPNHQTGVAFVRSQNGSAWSSRVGPSFEVNDLDFDGEFFVAVGNGAYATSPDGVTWTNRVAATGNWSECCVIGGDTVALRDAAESLKIVRSIESGTGEASFSVTAVSNSAPLSYQWQSSADGGSSWTNVSAATAAALTLEGITIADDGRKYRVVVSAPEADSVTSDAATLTVT